MQSIRHITVLVNPAAASNQGKRGWAKLFGRFNALFSSYDYKVIEATGREETIESAATLNTDLIIAVGGDGTAHDIAQGLMQRPKSERPALTVLPIGSGNDYAKSLGFSLDPRHALDELSVARRTVVDIGRCNGIFFLETLSFGVDAAVAFRTEELRKTSKSRGILLYASAALPTIINDLRPHEFHITIDSKTEIEKSLLICAVQLGPTYGGGFRIAPNAKMDDGLFDICFATEMNKPQALYYLSLIARGKHEGKPHISTLKARTITFDFDDELPTQFDGERLRGTRFEVECVPQALEVFVPRTSNNAVWTDSMREKDNAHEKSRV
ncbi:MAG: diacylglycerol kinase family lipid kinase [Coriobacteriales bacterium]|jgi:YegS/Rv2252/BmrU family lipid kinase|nr:diacylglycerol kinase family lipid kinase [Coriobacteriales bacterium]